MIERQAARFAVDVADALHELQRKGKTTYGDFYVTEVTFGFEGEDAGFRVIVNEFDDFSIDEIPYPEPTPDE